MSAERAGLSPTTRPGAVSLTVSDLPRARGFYADALGLTAGDAGADGAVVMAASGGEPLVVLHEDRAARPRDPRAPGLFHLAILLPTRADLGSALARLVSRRRALSGASDHLVSEALYLSDPEGNGIELYRDRPRDDWPRGGDGTVEMATLPLDVRRLLADAGDDGGDATMPADTRIGHVHLQVGDIPRAEAFYADLIGFDPTVRGYPGALFVSAGGYHHHLGLNTWNSAGAAPVAAGTAGLLEFEILVDGPSELAAVTERLRDAGVDVPTADDDARGPGAFQGTGPGAAVRVVDPFGSTVVLRAA